MSHVQKIVAVGSREELAHSNSQEKIGEKVVRQNFGAANFGAATAVENHSFALKKGENAKLEELEVIQEEGRQLLRISREEEEEHAEFKLQHVDNEKQNRWLKCLQKTSRGESEMPE